MTKSFLRVFRLAVTAALCVSVAGSPAIAAASWNQLQGDSAHTGRTDARSLSMSMRRWAVDVGGEITGAPAISPNGTVWVGAGDAGVAAVSTAGVLRHRTKLTGAVSRSVAVGADGSAYVGTDGMTLSKVSDGGALQWTQTNVGGANAGVSIAPDGTVLYGGMGSMVRAYHPSGTEKWAFKMPGEVAATAAVTESTIHTGTQGGWLYALNDNGTSKWWYFAGVPVMSSPTVGPNGVVTIGDDSGFIHALSAGGQLLWKYETKSKIRGTGAVAADGTVYYGAENGVVYAIKNGALVWQYNTGSAIHGGPSIASDVLYVGNQGGRFMALNLNGTLRWSAQTDGAIVSTPAIAPGGTVYVGTRGGKLWAFTTGVLGPQEATKRLGGADRVATAVRASQAGFPYGADAAVVVTGWSPWDALSGATLAAAAKGPMLLSKKGSLSSDTAAELKRLGVKRVYILGGEGALSAAVFDAARGIAGDAVRIAGSDRYETSAQVSREAVKLWGGAVQRSALMVSGENFPDALAAAPVACAKQWPLLLTRKSTVPASIKDTLSPLNVTQVFLIGGSAVVDYQSIKPQLTGVVTFSIAGKDRYETSAKVAELAVGRGLKPNTILLATGTDYPDALTGGVLAWRTNGVLLLTRPKTLPPVVETWIEGKSSDINRVLVLGTTHVVADAPFIEAQRAAGLR